MSKRELVSTSREDLLHILDSEKYLHLALADQNQPYIFPMNFGYTLDDDTLTFYLHGSLTGKKYEIIANNPNVAISIETDIKPFEGKVACQYGTSYLSLSCKGTISIIENPDEKIKAMEIFMHSQTGKDFTFNDRLVSAINVMKVSVSDYIVKKRPVPVRLASKTN